MRLHGSRRRPFAHDWRARARSRAPGTFVSIAGSYFCAQPEPEDPDDVDPLECDHIGAVTFGTSGANIGQYTELLVVAEVPAVATDDVLVFVTVVGRTLNSATFTVELAP
ncbi:MAG: IPT/TIG domain-containing protein [Kofleriaceae bacterium]